MTVIINAGALYVQDNEAETEEGDGKSPADTRGADLGSTAQHTHSAVGCVSRPLPRSAQPACLPAGTGALQPHERPASLQNGCVSGKGSSESILARFTGGFCQVL